MKLDELDIKYDFSLVEKDKYKFWLENNCFLAGGDYKKLPFSLVIPPPNITGKLHIGHVWDTSLQDTITRRKRMQGFDTLYLPGMDHASIATQARIEAKLKRENTDKSKIGREKFLEIAWSWKNDMADTIKKQWELIGLGLDYTKERFTMDEKMNATVNEVFKKMYDDSLIYKGKKIVNWDSNALTAISDIEVIYKEEEGFLYYIKYFLADENKSVIIATTRPETMFADQALMVNPKDTRYKDLVGKSVIIPLTNIVIPIIKDSYVDKDFGSGVVKVTPAHDPNDYEVGVRHQLAMPLCIDEDGKLNDLAGAFSGLDRIKAREEIVNTLKEKGFLDHIEKITHAVGYSERTNCVIEPRLSSQWFVKMKPLVKPLIENQQNAKTKINFVPKQFEKIYLSWLKNIEDWCISRQLWWGHRIPVYTKGEKIVVGSLPKEKGFVQENDVLDTWFSSSLWPFATLDWPNGELYKRFYPNDVLVTGYDILFFWVVRMAFQGYYCTHKNPFKTVVLHGLIRDSLGRKISKSLDNGVDINLVIKKYGIDSVRLFLTTTGTLGQDIRYSDEKLAASWNYINKIWNISRFIGLMFKKYHFTEKSIDEKLLLISDKWILTKLNHLIFEVDKNFEKFELGEVSKSIYKFVWEDFASWYIEISKIKLNNEIEKVKENILAVLAYVLKSVLKLLHPFMPFVTEDIYSKFNKEILATSSWPVIEKKYEFIKAKALEPILELITSVRNARNTFGKSLKEKLDITLIFKDEQTKLAFLELKDVIDGFINCGEVSFVKENKDYYSIVLEKVEILILRSGLINREEEILKHQKELDRLLKECARCEAMLKNPRFLEKAPKEKIDAEREKLSGYKDQLKTVKEIIEKL